MAGPETAQTAQTSQNDSSVKILSVTSPLTRKQKGKIKNKRKIVLARNGRAWASVSVLFQFILYSHPPTCVGCRTYSQLRHMHRKKEMDINNDEQAKKSTCRNSAKITPYTPIAASLDNINTRRNAYTSSNQARSVIRHHRSIDTQKHSKRKNEHGKEKDSRDKR